MPAPLPSPYSPQRGVAARGQAPTKSPVVRGQAPVERPATLKAPTPEELGIRLGKAEAPLDWNQLRRQLDQLGATSFQLDKHGNGFRFACRMTAGVVEGVGASEAEAVRIALAKAPK
jgi:hypothetical protein